MRSFPQNKGLYTLCFNKFRFAYELTDQSIVISAIIHPSMLQRQTKMLELATLMNRYLPKIIEDLFEIIPTHSFESVSADKTQSFITINIPTNNNSNSTHLNINAIHERLLNELNCRFEHFDIRWLGLLEPSTGPTP